MQNTKDLLDPQIRPPFADLDAHSISEHIEDITAGNPFPVEVFPEATQKIITATNKSLKYPIDFTASGLLFTASIAIGNTHAAEVMNGWQEKAVLYLAIVGLAGTNKSHPMSFALEPINRRDNKAYQTYLDEKIEYDFNASLSKKDREELGCGDLIKPTWSQILASDFTLESLIDVHAHNRSGIGVYADELVSFFKNFNRYNKGSEEQFWLSNWSNKPIRVNRKISGPAYIEQPFISVGGTIQPGVLREMADNRIENGFVDRVLFAVPDNLKKEYWSETELDPSIMEIWQGIVSKLFDAHSALDENGNPQPQILRFTPDAKRILSDWQRALTDESNAPGNESVSGINAKIEIYAIRLALILQLLRYACGEDDNRAIDVEAVEGAIKLVKYFKNTALKVRSLVSNVSPLDRLPTDKQALYSALPEAFTTAEGVQIAGDLGFPERSFKRFLKSDLFNNPSRGEYEKRI